MSPRFGIGGSCRCASASRSSASCCSGCACWLALALTIAAAARPQTATSIVRTAGVDFVVLQDGSASMHVGDVRRPRDGSNRWQRSTRFLRTLGESLRWEDDRVALALFAHIATPQVRLTRDPEYLLLLPRSPRDRLAVPPRGRHVLGHEHRARHLLGLAAVREGRGTAGQVGQRQGVHPDLRRPGVERRGGQVDRPRPGPRHSHPRRSASGRRLAASSPTRSGTRRRPPSGPFWIAARCRSSRPPAADATSSWTARKTATSPTRSST